MTPVRAAMPPGLLVAAPASGSGKTTVTLGLLAALGARGLSVQPFKCGPDYIDPAFHAAASGRTSFNLDSWAMPAAQIARIAQVARGADLVLAEGAMGLFDGVAASGAAGSGASADIAALMGWPVVLVLDISGQAQSAGAVAAGFARFRPGVRVAGVVLNRVASDRHAALARQGIAAAGLPVLGALPRDAGVALPERHLGLVQAGESPGLAARIAAMGALVAAHLDLDALIAAATQAPGLPAPAAAPPRPPGQRIALARDAAFTFAYPHHLADWHAQGAEILPFSPLADQGPDPSADVCWLPGGYPELHAGALASAQSFIKDINAFAKKADVHGECGGYMVMGQALIDARGDRHAMCGLLGLVTSFARRRLHLGYRHALLAGAMPGHAAGARLAGHEFHYSTVIDQPDAALAAVTDAGGLPVAETGSRRGRATGSFFHLIGPA